MTLLTMCQQVARETGYPVPGTIISNSNETAKRLLAAAQTEGKVLGRGRKPDGMGYHDWAVLRKEQTFSTSNGTESYAVKGAGSVVTDSDFLRFVDDTFYDRTNQRKLFLFTPDKWQWLKSSITSNSSIDRVIIQRGNSLFINPTPSSTDTLVFEYVSTKWCESSGGTDQTAWTADSDVGLLDEDLIGLGVKWRFLSSLGLPYAEEKEEYEQEVLIAMAADGGNQPLLQSTPVVPFGRIPDTGFGS